ncbi:RNA polymerase II-binding domain-containing protein [Triangularia verruculosa]|uniref:RNA polymerase II-binding domain-containing protein n=1 Tax=Triangularia verruculosa TaxID=2587418 RepID=A0AAN7AWD7_9PEZI|nr:RNA polymerase II-binding domain-containing protein [Triangularia verruculosa]
MAYTDDAVLSKLSALNETHESIATTAQWIMFHRRHATQTVNLWLGKLKDLPPPKRLNMIYLANEVTQQTKARQRDDFINAFGPVIAEATASAYKGANPDVQNKLRRVVDVWRDRSVFDKDTILSLYERMGELDKSRPTNNGGTFGGSGFNSSGPPVPSELAPLVTQYQAATRTATPMKTALTNAQTEYEKLSDPATTQTTALPLQAARLNGLLKNLSNAEGAVAESIRTRREMIRSLEKLLAENQNALQQEEAHMKLLSGRRTEIEQKKNQVEATILGGQVAKQEPGATGDRTSTEPEPPQFEALTPPHHSDADDEPMKVEQNGNHSAVVPQQTPIFPVVAPGIEMLSSVAANYQAVPVNGSSKKRKVAPSDDFPDLGNDGIDEDVQEMLRKESQSA